MQTPILTSTFFLTLLLMVGLFFFIRASTKDRTEVAQFISNQPQDQLLEELQSYFTQRAYRLVHVDAEHNTVTFEGFVQSSWFLAGFLTLLAAVGIFCLTFVLSYVLPHLSIPLLGLVLLAPGAGLFYWRRASRSETVLLRVEPVVSDSQANQMGVIVTAHRDELLELQRSLGLERSEDLVLQPAEASNG